LLGGLEGFRERGKERIAKGGKRLLRAKRSESGRRRKDKRKKHEKGPCRSRRIGEEGVRRKFTKEGKKTKMKLPEKEPSLLIFRKRPTGTLGIWWGRKPKEREGGKEGFSDAGRRARTLSFKPLPKRGVRITKK